MPKKEKQGVNLHRSPLQRICRIFCCCFHIQEADGGSLPPARPSRAPRPRQHRQPSKPKYTESWIPPYTPAEIAHDLRVQLCRPLSKRDESGYIYVFWLAPKGITTRMAPAAFFSSMIAAKQTRSMREAIKALAAKPTETHPGTIRLKIGRSNNVQRRLNEWTRQCSHNVALVRCYPSQQEKGMASKVPYCHRVEHLIHIELRDRRIRNQGKCSQCGRKHREWFEIKADETEPRKVDACIRRWIMWGQIQARNSLR